MDGWMDGWMDGLDLWIYGFMDLWIYGFMDLWIYGFIGERGCILLDTFPCTSLGILSRMHHY